MKEVFANHSHLGNVLPAMGYGEEQMSELERTIADTPCDLVLAGTPIDLRRLLSVEVPVVRVTYEIVEKSKPDLNELIESMMGDT